MFLVNIDQESLIDALENQLGGIYEKVQEGDTIIQVRLWGEMVEFTIGVDRQQLSIQGRRV